MDRAHAAYAMRYVEFHPVRANPVRTGMEESVLDYEWSSARAHTGMTAGREDEDIDVTGWTARYTPEKWKEVLGLGFRESRDLDRLREATRTGRPFEAPGYVEELEAKMERNLAPQKRGRKRKEKAEAASAGENQTDTIARKLGKG